MIFSENQRKRDEKIANFRHTGEFHDSLPLPIVEISKNISKNLQNLPSFPFLSVSEYILQNFRRALRKLEGKIKSPERFFL